MYVNTISIKIFNIYINFLINISTIEIDCSPVGGVSTKPLYKVQLDDNQIFYVGEKLLQSCSGIDGLISRKELIDILDKDSREAFTKHQVWTMIVYGIKEANSTIFGEWLINSDGYYPYCSNCKESPEGKMTNFCPNCGADMCKQERKETSENFKGDIND